MGPSFLVKKKGKYKLSELRKKIGKLTAEGTVMGERVAVKTVCSSSCLNCLLLQLRSSFQFTVHLS